MKRWGVLLAGALGGAANGLFGGGGGMVLLPLLKCFSGLKERQLYPTCVAVIFPVCAVSALVYWVQVGFPLGQALPYLLGGAAGGYLGGRLYGRIPTAVLKWLFAAFLCYGGVRYLW